MRAFLLVVVWVCIASSPVRAQSLNVLATIKPLQLLVQEIGGEAVDVDLLIEPTQSAHDFQLRPSDLQRVDDADLVIWMGPALEHYLKKALRKAPQAQALYPKLDQGDDPHQWLDAEAVQKMARKVARMLSDRQPTRSAYFHSNAARFSSELRQYDKALGDLLNRCDEKPYLFVHDGYGLFEARYNLTSGEAVMKDEGRLPGTRHMTELRQRLQAGEFVCVFSEPQFPQSVLGALMDGVETPVVELDPMGIKVQADQGFMALYRAIGDAFLNCVGTRETRAMMPTWIGGLGRSSLPGSRAATSG